MINKVLKIYKIGSNKLMNMPTRECTKISKFLILFFRSKLLIGNKIDMEGRCVSNEEASNLAR